MESIIRYNNDLLHNIDPNPDAPASASASDSDDVSGDEVAWRSIAIAVVSFVFCFAMCVLVHVPFMAKMKAAIEKGEQWDPQTVQSADEEPHTTHETVEADMCEPAEVEMHNFGAVEKDENIEVKEDSSDEFD